MRNGQRTDVISTTAIFINFTEYIGMKTNLLGNKEAERRHHAYLTN